MRILIFSDSHLSSYFDEKKFQFLKKIITSFDQVIINGDFWEGYNTTFNQFIQSPWKNLFPLLLARKTVYIFGNHDKKGYVNNNYSLFSTQQTSLYSFSSGNKKFHVEHGDRLVPMWDSLFERMPWYINNPLDLLERFLVRTFGTKYLQTVFGIFNEKVKRRMPKGPKKNELFVFGHTHCAEVDLENKFINTGLIKHGLGQYIVIEDGKIEAKEEWYD